MLQEINGWDADGGPLSSYAAAQGRRLDRLRLLDLLRRATPTASTRPPGASPAREQNWVAPEWGWAWPANRRMLYNRASADPDGRPWSERKAYVWWDEEQGKWTGHDVPDFSATKRPTTCRPRERPAQDALAGVDPFIMQADGKAGCTCRPA